MRERFKASGKRVRPTVTGKRVLAKGEVPLLLVEPSGPCPRLFFFLLIYFIFILRLIIETATLRSGPTLLKEIWYNVGLVA